MALDRAARAELRARLGAAAPSNSGGIQTNGGDAVAQLQQRYVQLSVWGAKLAALSTGVSCSVRTAYYLALKDYFVNGVDLFHQLTSQGATIQQVVYKNGQPVLDQFGDGVLTAVTTPLMPPFLPADPACPSLAQQGLAGRLGRALGQFGQAAVAWAAIQRVVTAAWPLVFIIGGAIATKAVLDQLTVLVRGYNTTPDQQLVAFLSCVDKAVAAGISQADATKQCGGKDAGMSGLAWVGLVSLILVAGGGAAYYIFKKTSTGERAHRHSIEEAEAEAERAASAAAEARSRARAVKAGRMVPSTA
jgi:hypothetical protein